MALQIGTEHINHQAFIRAGPQNSGSIFNCSKSFGYAREQSKQKYTSSDRGFFFKDKHERWLPTWSFSKSYCYVLGSFHYITKNVPALILFLLQKSRV